VKTGGYDYLFVLNKNEGLRYGMGHKKHLAMMCKMLSPVDRTTHFTIS